MINDVSIDDHWSDIRVWHVSVVDLSLLTSQSSCLGASDCPSAGLSLNYAAAFKNFDLSVSFGKDCILYSLEAAQVLDLGALPQASDSIVTLNCTTVAPLPFDRHVDICSQTSHFHTSNTRVHSMQYRLNLMYTGPSG